MLYIVEDDVYLYAKLDVVVGFGSSYSINDSNEMLGDKSLPLICIRSIEDGALRFFHVAREEEASLDRICLIVNRHLRCRHASTEVYQVHLISAVINLRMKG